MTDVLSTLVAVLSLGLGMATLVYSRRDRREDLRLRREERERLADVDREERETVRHAHSASEARLAYEEAERAREAVVARYARDPARGPLLQPRMALAASLGIWGLILADANSEDRGDADPANLGIGVGVAVVGIMIAVRGLQGAQRERRAAVEVVWGLLVILGAAGVIACLIALDAYGTP